jgi:hypothetical protein
VTARPTRLVLAAVAAGTLLLGGCSNDADAGDSGDSAGSETSQDSGGSDDSGDSPGEEQDATELQRFEGDGFAIDLPGEPTSDTQTVPTQAGDIEVTLYSVDTDDASVAVAVTVLPPGTPIDLDGAVNGAATNVGGEVVESETGEFDGYETRDATISVAASGQEGTGFLRVIDADGRLIQIQQIVAGGDVAEAPDSYDEIVDSLEIS